MASDDEVETLGSGDVRSPEAPDAAPAKKDRRSLSDAVFPLVGVLLGGLLAAGASLFTAHIEAKAQERQAIEQYRRDNREKIYADLLAQVSGVDNVIKQVQIQTAAASARKPLKDADAGGAAEDDMEIFNRLNGQFQPAYDRLSTAVSDVELVGSHRVIDLSKALQESYFVSFNELVVPRDVIVKLGFRGLQPANSSPPASAPDSQAAPGNSGKEGAAADENLADLPPATLKQMLVGAAKEDLAFND
jgi:hypothetical protein